MSNFSFSLTRNITSHSMKNLSFHSLLRWKMMVLPILATVPHTFFKCWENVLFELRSEMVKKRTSFINLSCGSVVSMIVGSMNHPVLKTEEQRKTRSLKRTTPHPPSDPLQSSNPPGEYSHIWTIRGCAAQQGMVLPLWVWNRVYKSAFLVWNRV